MFEKFSRLKMFEATTRCCRGCFQLSAILVLLLALFVAFLVKKNELEGRPSRFPIFNQWQGEYDLDANLAQLNSQTIIITGASAGLGLASAQILSSRGAKVIMACRNEQKARSAMHSIWKANPKAELELEIVDFSEMHSVKEFANRIKKTYNSLDMLMLNAGMVKAQAMNTIDGFNSVFQVNHFAQAYLFYELLPLLRKSRLSRVALVSSGTHKEKAPEGLVQHSLTWENRDKIDYKGMNLYAISKLYQIQFAMGVTRELQESGVDNVLVNSLMPGAVQTEIFSKWREKPFEYAITEAVLVIMKALGLMHDVFTGALTQVHCVASKEVMSKKLSGQYFMPTGFLTKPRSEDGASNLAYNEDLQNQLMQITHRFIDHVNQSIHVN